MADAISVQILGLKETVELIDGMRLRTADLRPAWRVIDKRLSLFFRKQFETSGQAGFAPWKPLAEATKRARVRPGGNRGGINRPLWDTARLKGSLQAPGPESIRVFAPQLYERGSTVPYADKHDDRPVIPDPLPGFMLRAWLRDITQHVFAESEGPAPSPAV